MAEWLGTGLVGVQPCVTTRPVFFWCAGMIPAIFSLNGEVLWPRVLTNP